MPRLGQFCRVRPAPHAVACPAPHPHGRRTAAGRERVPAEAPPARGRGAGERAPSRPAHAARRRQPPCRLRTSPSAASARRLALTLTSLLFFRRSEAAPLGSGVRARRAGWRRSTGHEPARALAVVCVALVLVLVLAPALTLTLTLTLAPAPDLTPRPRPSPARARRPGCSRRGSGACAARARHSRGRTRPARPREGQRARAGWQLSEHSPTQAPLVRVASLTPIAPALTLTRSPLRAAPRRQRAPSGRGGARVTSPHGPRRTANAPPGPRGPRGGQGSGWGQGPSADRGAPPT